MLNSNLNLLFIHYKLIYPETASPTFLPLLSERFNTTNNINIADIVMNAVINNILINKMNQEFKEVADHITDFYSTAGKKLVPQLNLISRVFKSHNYEQYNKPITPASFKVQPYTEN